MKYALQKLPNGESRMVDANGCPLGSSDADRPILHILPKLLVPAGMLGAPSEPFEGLACEEIALTVTTSLPIDVLPEGGIQVRQPYPNPRYFVGGSQLIRNGWIVPLPLDATEFDIEFHWHIESASVWRVFPKDDWVVRHVLHLKLHPGKGMTYSMDASCWPKLDGPAMRVSPVTVLGVKEEEPIDRKLRQIVKDSDLIYTDGEMKGELAGYFIEETVEIPGVPLEQAWGIDAFQNEQLHEVRQTAILTLDIDAHRANGPIEMPAELFVEAVNLAEKVPFDKESEFAVSVANVPGGLERHPAMKLLCEWWQTVRPEGEPFKPGSAMPMVRVRDDGQYWWGDHQIPNAPIADFNPSGRDVARIGDVMLVLFQATQDNAIFDKDGMSVFLPSGEHFSTIEIDRAEYLSGESDEAWACLNALASFRSRFFSAWRFLNRIGGEYRMAERAKVARPIALPEGFKPCSNCGGLPEITEDPTGQFGRRFQLKCGDHASIGGDSLEEVRLDWEFDYEGMEETRC
ncbi:hypothetical protein [Ralstonia insidiosa]|jgi:hypothetical protein|nr:hypothetical protein [Ralstonia insidiosa]MBA9939839.1 hypothetical protein [Ralstonia insidiosa]MBC9968505.1 hypothetical protein [Ralstonia insidiosa]MBX3904674.1 hypothetical protein [Ralstonia insidiosa]